MRRKTPMQDLEKRFQSIATDPSATGEASVGSKKLIDFSIIQKLVLAGCLMMPLAACQNANSQGYQSGGYQPQYQPNNNAIVGAGAGGLLGAVVANQLPHHNTGKTILGALLGGAVGGVVGNGMGNNQGYPNQGYPNQGYQNQGYQSQGYQSPYRDYRNNLKVDLNEQGYPVQTALLIRQAELTALSGPANVTTNWQDHFGNSGSFTPIYSGGFNNSNDTKQLRMHIHLTTEVHLLDDRGNPVLQIHPLENTTIINVPRDQYGNWIVGENATHEIASQFSSLESSLNNPSSPSMKV